MGSFFTNLQVKANEQNVDELISALVAAVQSQGFTFAQGSDSLPADREILLQPAENGWIAVYDEAAESQDSKILDKLAKVVSKELGTFVITTLVHDSDVLNLSLYHSGKVLNTYNSNPGYFGETVSEKNRTKLLGNETRWAPLLRPDVTKKHLRDIFDSKDLFAEHTLRKIAQAIGVDEGAISTGYRYLDRTQNAPKSLRFRRKDRPLYEQKSDGPPRFEPSLGVAEQTCVLSAEDVLHLSGSVENKGGAGAGLRFVIWGAAIEKNLIELTKLQVIIGNAAMREQSGNLTLQDLLQGKTPPPYWDDLTLRTIKSDQGAVLEAILPEKEFNAGMKHPMMTPGGDWQKHFEAVNETKIHVNLFGTVTKEGSGIFYLAIAPLQHKDTKGAAVLSYHVNVEPSLQKPLRFAVDPDAANEYKTFVATTPRESNHVYIGQF